MTTAMFLTIALFFDATATQPNEPGRFATLCADHELDREFYNDYLDAIPDERVRRKEILEQNLLRVARTVIPREDSDQGQKFADSLKAADLTYGQVTRESPFVRGIFKEMPYLKETAYMWVVKSGRYIIFVTYRADPRLFLVTAHQTRTVLKPVKDAPTGKSDEPASSKQP